MVEKNRKYWVVRLGEGGCYVPNGVKGNYIAIGWDKIGNLISIKDDLSDIKKRYREVYPEDHNVSVGLNSGQLHTFASKISKGDLISVPYHEIYICEVIGDYTYKTDWKDGCHYGHRREVKWIGKIKREQLPKEIRLAFSPWQTVFNFDKWGTKIESIIPKKLTKIGKIEDKIISKPKLEDVVGEPINFRGFVYAPLNEAGVILLFSSVMKDLDFFYESSPSRGVDLISRKKIGDEYIRRRVEFEYKSSNFVAHKHNVEDCDLIVCWKHDWVDCPLEVIELKEVIKELPD